MDGNEGNGRENEQDAVNKLQFLGVQKRIFTAIDVRLNLNI